MMQISFFLELSEYTRLLKVFKENPTLKPQNTISKIMRYLVEDFLYHNSSSVSTKHYLWKKDDFYIDPKTIKIRHGKIDLTDAIPEDF